MHIGIYQYLFQDLGIRVPVSGAISGGVAAGGNTTYTLTLSNDGETGTGLAAEDLTIAVMVPAGAKGIAGTGSGYKGLQKDAKIAGGAEGATWKVSRLQAPEKQIYTVTFAGEAPEAGLKGSVVTRAKPALGEASPTRNDSVAVAIPQPRPAAASH